MKFCGLFLLFSLMGATGADALVLDFDTPKEFQVELRTTIHELLYRIDSVTQYFSAPQLARLQQAVFNPSPFDVNGMFNLEKGSDFLGPISVDTGKAEKGADQNPERMSFYTNWRGWKKSNQAQKEAALFHRFARYLDLETWGDFHLTQLFFAERTLFWQKIKVSQCLLYRLDPSSETFVPFDSEPAYEIQIAPPLDDGGLLTVLPKQKKVPVVKIYLSPYGLSTPSPPTYEFMLSKKHHLKLECKR